MFGPRAADHLQDAPGTIFEVPEVIADHALLRCIGQGSYGRVYLARNQLTGVYRALKIVFREAFRDARPYLREFEAICSFEPVSRSHHGFVQILHVGKLENAFYYIMELADDSTRGPLTDPETYVPRTLSLNRAQMLPIEQCVDIGSRLADSLAVLHDRKLIHRDIKPSNIIFVHGCPKLADIGLVTQIEEAKSLVGTAGFMPPEGPISPASDVYSLGKVLYEMATGKDRCEFPQLPSDITPENALDLELNQIVLRACDPDPAKRYKTAHDLRRELDLLQAGRSIKRLRQVEKRLRFFKFAFAASILIGVASFLAYYQVKSRRERAERERERLAGYLLAEGTSEMRKGYLAYALPFFIRAAEYDPANLRSHQLRIGSVFSDAPRRVLEWKSPVRARFSWDGEWLIAPDGRNLIIFETISGRAIKTIPLEGDPAFAEFSPDQTKVAVAVGATALLLTTTGERIASHEFNDVIREIAFSPGDSRMALSLTNGSAYFWDAESNSVEAFPGSFSVNAITFDSRGERLFTADVDSHLSHLRDARTGEVVSSPINVELPYFGVFSPDGSNVIVCGWGSAVPFKASNAELAGSTMDNDDAVMHGAFSPSGRVVATANYDGTVRFWDGRTFKPLALNHILEHESRPERIAFIDELTLIVHCTDGRNFVWNLGTKPPKAAQIPRVNRPDPLNFQEQNAVLSAHDKTISGTIRGKEIYVQFPNSVSALAISPKLEAFAAGSKDAKFDITHALLYRLSDMDNPIRLNHRDGINYIAFSHSGEKLITCSEDFSAILWDARDGRRLTQPMRHRWQVHWASFSSDDRWVVTAGWDAVCIIWNAADGEPLTTPLKFPEWLNYVAFEPGDAGIIAGGATNDYRMDLPFAELPLKDQADYFRNMPELPLLAR